LEVIPQGRINDCNLITYIAGLVVALNRTAKEGKKGCGHQIGIILEWQMQV
jgi:hypothetical protein